MDYRSSEIVLSFIVYILSDLYIAAKYTRRRKECGRFGRLRIMYFENPSDRGGRLPWKRCGQTAAG